MKRELRAKKGWRIFCNVILENELVSILLSTIVAAAIKMYGDFLNFGQLSINSKLAEILKTGVLTLCKSFVKKVNLNV